MHALAAEELLSFIAGAAECNAQGGVLAPNNAQGNPRPRLVQSTMDLHFNVGQMPDGTNFGRAQLDVISLKVLLCVVVSTPEQLSHH